MTEINEKNKVLNLYPIDYPFETLINRLTSDPKKLHLNPDFQRKYKWDKDGHERGSKFIESCLMRIPLPACYFAELDDGTHDVIDGVQRITTIQNFFNDEFALENLTIFKELEGKKFSQLGGLRDDLFNTTIRCIILRKENPKYLVNEIFARLNQGAVKLEPQEIRHAVYPGSLDDLLIELSHNEIIKEFKKGEKEKNSRENEEVILRYFALQSDSFYTEYEGNLTRYLDGYMEKNQNLPALDIDKLKNDFNTTLGKCLKVFSPNDIFRDMTNNRSIQGLIYYDLLMWYFKQLSEDVIDNNKDRIKQSFEQLCNNPEFKRTKTSRLQTKSSILKRRRLLKENIGLL